MIKLRFQVMGTEVALHIADTHQPRAEEAVPWRSSGPGQPERTTLRFMDRACPKCSFDRPRRMARESWMARRIMHYFGCYPWECPMCRVQFYRKNRLDQEQRLLTTPAQLGAQNFGPPSSAELQG